MKLEYTIKKEDNEKTIHEILTANLGISTRLLNKLIKNSKILRNQKICDTRYKVNPNDQLTIDFSTSENSSNIVPIQMELSIVYEDAWFLVINKPAGIPIHPSRAHYEDSLSNGVKFYFDTIRIGQKDSTCQSFRSRHFWSSYFCQMRIHTRMFYSTDV